MTKEKIFNAALNLFCERSFDKVSVRDIAEAVGIKAASIYNHFQSKEEILNSFYEFYTANIRDSTMDLNELKRMAEQTPPENVLMQINHDYSNFNEDIQEPMNRVIAVAVREIHSEISEKFLSEQSVGGIKLFKPLLEYMIEKKLVEPIDIDTFLDVIRNYTYYAASLYGTSYAMDEEKRLAGLRMVFSLVKPLNNSAIG